MQTAANSTNATQSATVNKGENGVYINCVVNICVGEAKTQSVETNLRIGNENDSKDVNINMNISINKNCNTNNTQNLVKYVTIKRPLNITQNKRKIQKLKKSENSPNSYITFLENLETPVLLSNISNELEYLSKEFYDLQTTINRLQYGDLEINDVYIWDELY